MRAFAVYSHSPEKTAQIDQKVNFFPTRGGQVVNLTNGEVRNRCADDFFTFESPASYIPQPRPTWNSYGLYGATVYNYFEDDVTFLLKIFDNLFFCFVFVLGNR